MQNHIVAALIVLAYWLPMQATAHDPSAVATVQLEKEPFAYSYHGVLVDSNMKELELSPTHLEAILHYYTDSTIRSTQFENYEQYQRLNNLLREDRELSALERVKVRAQIAQIAFSQAHKLMEKDHGHELPVDELRRWQEKTAAARLNVPKAFGIKASGEELAKTVNGISTNTRAKLEFWVAKYNLKAFQTLVIVDYVLWPLDWLYPNSDPYISQCREAGVPIPPAFGNSQWTYIGQLNNEFIDASSEAHAYTYTSASPQGTCIALPRKNASGGASVLGIICLGIETENACFWDRYGTTAQELAGTIPISDFIPGTEFDGSAGNCASCHAGENPFVIHPEADISGGANISVDWHNPIFNPAWPANPGPMSLPSDTSYSSAQWWNPFSWFDEREPGASCVGCHKLPDVNNPTVRNQGYCNSVLKLAAERTMPPWSSGTAGWGSSNDSDYQVHIERLYDLCN